MRYGFIIDNRKCIGCHACSTACKSEHEVPLGVHRTWVKYVEKGVFPDTRRYFQVTRCNHCENPPCVTICPVSAMFQRKDGIVDFDPASCIGCKGCLEACPYDAIYIDPASSTAAKCNYCAHRTDVGLEPACVVVCPEHAILAGDLDDPGTEIARTLAMNPVRVRNPEQATRPKLFYIAGEESALVPMVASQSEPLMWSERPPESDGWRGPIHIGEGRMAGALMDAAGAPRETHGVSHRIPWHWQVPAYLTAKAVGAGAFFVAALGLAAGVFPETPFFTTFASFLALFFVGLNTLFIVLDLDRPDRFWTILVRPQWRSWLARGAYVLVAFTLVASAYLAGGWAGVPAARLLLWPGVLLAILTAVYTAFLFAQAEGRDLWQGALVPWHMFVQAAMAGSAALLFAVPFFGVDPQATRALTMTFAASAVVNLLMTVGGELGQPHASRLAAAASRLMTHGRYRLHFWGSVVVGLVLPLALCVLGGTSTFALSLASLLAIGGLLAYEWAFVMSAQAVPNS